MKSLNLTSIDMRDTTHRMENRQHQIYTTLRCKIGKPKTSIANERKIYLIFISSTSDMSLVAYVTLCVLCLFDQMPWRYGVKRPSVDPEREVHKNTNENKIEYSIDENLPKSVSDVSVGMQVTCGTSTCVYCLFFFPSMVVFIPRQRNEKNWNAFCGLE